MHVQTDEVVRPATNAIPAVFATLVPGMARIAAAPVPDAVVPAAPSFETNASAASTPRSARVVAIGAIGAGGSIGSIGSSDKVKGKGAAQREDVHLPAYVVVDDQLRVLDHDAAAARLFACPGSELTINRGMLTASSMERQRILASSLNAARAEHGNQPRTCKLSAEMRFQLYPLYEARSESRALRGAVAAAGARRNHLIVFSAPQRLAGIPDVASRYRLSRSEARLLEALCTDSRLKEYAHMNNVSTHTVRTQLRSILAKLGVHSQIEAVRTVLHSVIACA